MVAFTVATKRKTEYYILGAFETTLEINKSIEGEDIENLFYLPALHPVSLLPVLYSKKPDTSLRSMHIYHHETDKM